VSVNEKETKAIEEIAIGDAVMSYNCKTGSLDSTVVRRVDTYQVNEFAAIRLSNGQTLTTTVNHPIFVKGCNGYCCVEPNGAYPRALAVGDEVVLFANDCDCRSSKSVFVSSINVQLVHSDQTSQLPKVFAVYVASPNKNMFANGVLVHNGSGEVDLEPVIIKVRVREFPFCSQCQFDEAMDCARVMRGDYQCSRCRQSIYFGNVIYQCFYFFFFFFLKKKKNNNKISNKDGPNIQQSIHAFVLL
ncbi:hypothetical protein RFI_37977, partial [Reticulomyxa filosa]